MATTAYETGKFVWFELYSPKPQNSKMFWCELLGWKNQKQGDYDMLGPADNMALGLLDIAMLPPNTPPHFFSYLSVDDVDAKADAVARHGGRIERPPWDIPGIGRIAIVADTEDAKLGLYRPETDAQASGPAEMPGTFTWNELWAKNLDRATAFYENTFGFFHNAMPMPAGGTYHVLTQGDQPRGGIMLSPQSDQPAAWLPFVRVEDTALVVKRAQNMGAKIDVAPTEVPQWGVFAVIRDNVGATVGFATPRAP